MLVILVFLGGLVGLVASPTLAAVLIVAGLGAIRPERILTVLRTGAISQVAFVTTLLATLFLPVAAAVGIGVALSLVLQLDRDALDLRVVELVLQPDGRVLERAAPRRLHGETITILDVYGSLYYAGARTLQARLPEISDALNPVVILRLRGRTSLGATSLTVLSGYAERLGAAGGRLYLTGLDPVLMDQFERTGLADASESLQLFPATPIVGESSRLAEQDARAWLARRRAPERPA
jgi:SulP family sulfate permease